MADKILFDKRPDNIAVIIFNRPATMNALDFEAMSQFAQSVKRLTREEDLRAVIVTGMGENAFCSGGDLTELVTRMSADEGREMISLMGDALSMLERLPVPVIAAINGYALGGGSEIAVACDIRIIDEKAQLGFVQMRQALTPGWGAGQRLLRLVGYEWAMDLLLRAEVLSAHTVEKIGLAHRIVESGKAFDHALVYAKQIAECPPDVVKGVKTLLQAGLHYPYEDALGIERDIFPSLWAAESHLNAVNNFLNRQRKTSNHN